MTVSSVRLESIIDLVDELVPYRTLFPAMASKRWFPVDVAFPPLSEAGFDASFHTSPRDHLDSCEAGDLQRLTFVVGQNRKGSNPSRRVEMMSRIGVLDPPH